LEAYLDIETTGLSREYSEITVIGLLVTGHRSRRFVQLIENEISEEKLFDALDGVSLLHSFNGHRFDLPFIRYKLGINLRDHFDCCDLMETCHRCNLRGGLKLVEQTLRIPRKSHGINGFEAVRLWWRYKNDYDEDALKTLLEYNREDVINLELLKHKLATYT